ncbi:LuxR C-terminal-related transcriptional regulator [Amycolatopsis speibonae]|uniref:LuxR C-terminal-related transcriptional regulator n=1 Tax=Amycolatopsis speibonae TaxID=1450224 RepID=A0ABV7P3S3_9PSEU
MFKVLVVDADELTRAGICSILRGSGSVEVAADTGCGQRGVELARRLRPDVVVMDVADLNGVRVARVLAREVPSARVLVFTASVAEECVYRSFDAGVSGFVRKGVASHELIEAIAVVASGDLILSPSVTRCVIDKFLQFDQERARSARGRVQLLTCREREVLAQVVQGLGNAEIARTLFVSEGAVKAHVSHMLTKLGCANRVQAAIIAHDSGLFPPEPATICV